VTRAAAIALVCALAACGGDDRRVRPTARVDVEGGERTVVAEVNGRPIFGDCVATQAAAHGLDRHAAVDECIDFELLAQAAEARGLAADPEVREVQRREAVRQLVRRDFEAGHQGPADVPMEFIRDVWKNPRLRSAYDHPEYRFCHYVRAPVAKAQRGTPAEKEAETAMRNLYRELANRKLTRAELGDIVDRYRQQTSVKIELTDKPYDTPLEGKSGKQFARALFDIPEPGRVSPPTRTAWGWDVILLTRISPERHETVEQAADEIRKRVFAPWREQEFKRWSHELSAGHTIEVADNWTAMLPEDPLDLPPP